MGGRDGNASLTYSRLASGTLDAREGAVMGIDTIPAPTEPDENPDEAKPNGGGK